MPLNAEDSSGDFGPDLGTVEPVPASDPVVAALLAVALAVLLAAFTMRRRYT